jgi:hypothetical protein
MTEWTDDIQTLTNEAFMRIYRSPADHVPALKTQLDQGALGAGYKPSSSPTGEAARIAAERERRGLTWPGNWEAARGGVYRASRIPGTLGIPRGPRLRSRGKLCTV